MKAEAPLIPYRQLRRMSADQVSALTLRAVEMIRDFQKVETVRNFVNTIYTHVEVTQPHRKASAKAKADALEAVATLYSKYIEPFPTELLSRCAHSQLRYAVGTHKASQKTKVKALRVLQDMMGHKFAVEPTH